MTAYSDAVEERIKANPGRVLAAIVVAIGTTVALIVGLPDRGVLYGPALLMIHVSALAPVSDDGEYSGVRVAVENTGDATAELCTVNAYNRLPYSYEADETSVLGKSERFDLTPEGGRVTTLSLYLPALSGEALSGGGVRAPVSLRTECENAESPDYGRIITVSSPVVGSEAP